MPFVIPPGPKAAPRVGARPAFDRDALGSMAERFLSCVPLSAEVIDASGASWFANDRAERLADGFAHAGAAVPSDAREERLEVLRRALASGEKVRVVGVQGGVKRQWVICPNTASGLPAPWAVVFASGGPLDAFGDPSGATVRLEHDDWGPLAGLSPRELEVLTRIARGLSMREIAREMERSVKTVEFHRSALGAKLGVTNRVELTRLALRAGLVDLS
ncbi:MAG TPA: hypothetical protein DEB06_07410 [Phycisphaerales bacterium]|nr:hypothetical protein [Phycisphaerales bacterium]